MKKNMKTIQLEFKNGDIIKKLEIDFNELPEALQVKFLDYNMCIVTNVPDEVEIELSRLIFNRYEMEQIERDNIDLVRQIANHLPYHTPTH